MARPRKCPILLVSDNNLGWEVLNILIASQLDWPVRFHSGVQSVIDLWPNKSASKRIWNAYSPAPAFVSPRYVINKPN